MDCTWIACSPPGTSTCPASAWGRSLPSTSAGSQISSSLGELSHNLRLSTEVYLQLFKIHPNPSELICKNLSESISGKRSATALSVFLLRITWLSPHHSHRQTSEQTSVWGGGEDQNSHFYLVFTLKLNKTGGLLLRSHLTIQKSNRAHFHMRWSSSSSKSDAMLHSSLIISSII